MNPIREKLKTMLMRDLLLLAEELQKDKIPEDSIVRKILRDTIPQLETMNGFINLAADLGFEFADRIKNLIKERERVYYE